MNESFVNGVQTIFDVKMYRPGQPNLEIWLWVFQSVEILQFSCHSVLFQVKSILVDFRRLKTAILPILEGLNLVITMYSVVDCYNFFQKAVQKQMKSLYFELCKQVYSTLKYSIFIDLNHLLNKIPIKNSIKIPYKFHKISIKIQ